MFRTDQRKLWSSHVHHRKRYQDSMRHGHGMWLVRKLGDTVWICLYLWSCHSLIIFDMSLRCSDKRSVYVIIGRLPESTVTLQREELQIKRQYCPDYQEYISVTKMHGRNTKSWNVRETTLLRYSSLQIDAAPSRTRFGRYHPLDISISPTHQKSICPVAWNCLSMNDFNKHFRAP